MSLESARATVMAQLRQRVAVKVNSCAIKLQKDIITHFGPHVGVASHGPPSAPGTPPNVRSGTLRRDVQVINATAQTLRANIGTNVPYNKIQEFGGVIEPKKSLWLVFQYSKGKWASKKKVVLPARPYMRPAVARMRPKIAAEFKALCEGIKGL